MSLTCCTHPECYIETLTDTRTTCGTIICRECDALIPPGTEYTELHMYEIGSDWTNENLEITRSRIAVCDACGGAIHSYLSLGYCYAPGDLFNMVNEMRQLNIERAQSLNKIRLTAQK